MLTDHAGLSPFERLLTLFTRVRPGEGRSVQLYFLHGFLLLFCYMIVKALREAFMLTNFSAEVRAYAVAVIALVLMLVVPAYGAARRLCSAITRSRPRGRQPISVMQTAQHRSGAHAEALADSMAGGLCRRRHDPRWRVRHAWTERHVGASVVVMTHPCLQDQSQVRLRQRYQPVQALASNRSDHPFADCIGLRAVRPRLSTVRPSFNSNSLAIRSSPEIGFSVAMRRIS